MMKYVLSLFFIGIMFTAFGQNNSKYTLYGRVVDKAYEGQKVYLHEWNEPKFVKIDSAIISNGKFRIKGKVTKPALRLIDFGEAKGDITSMLMLEPGKIRISYNSMFSAVGTPINDAITAYTQNQLALDLRREALTKEVSEYRQNGSTSPSSMKDIGSEFSKVREDENNLEFEFIRDNIDNEVGQYLYIKNSGKFDFEKQKEILELASQNFKKRPDIRSMLKHFQEMERVAVGKDYIDFTMENLKGEPVSLSDYIGKSKYVFIDFWATWCGPCIAELPSIIKAYDKYKDKGLEVVGVSLDKDRDKWIQGVKDLNMTWPQMSDIKYWQSPVVKLYAILGVPHTVLIDQNGKIVANNLRGKMLEEKLAELLD